MNRILKAVLQPRYAFDSIMLKSGLLSDKQYIDILNSESPIFWDDFHWNEHYWDQNEKDVSGVGYIPHLYDGSIQGFKNYKG